MVSTFEKDSSYLHHRNRNGPMVNFSLELYSALRPLYELQILIYTIHMDSQETII